MANGAEHPKRIDVALKRLELNSPHYARLMEAYIDALVLSNEGLFDDLREGEVYLMQYADGMEWSCRPLKKKVQDLCKRYRERIAKMS